MHVGDAHRGTGLHVEVAGQGVRVERARGRVVGAACAAQGEITAGGDREVAGREGHVRGDDHLADVAVVDRGAQLRLVAHGHRGGARRDCDGGERENDEDARCQMWTTTTHRVHRAQSVRRSEGAGRLERRHLRGLADSVRHASERAHRG